MSSEKPRKEIEEKLEILKFLEEKNIKPKVALDILKLHFDPPKYNRLYPGHNPGGLH